MSIRDQGKDATKNPIQDAPDRIQEDVSKKEGPGYRRDADDVVGPDVRVPLVNAQDQSSRSNAATFNPPPAPRDASTNRKTIDRESLFQDQDELYGNT